MRIALVVLILATGCAASSGGGGSSTHAIDKPGCLWVGQAENTYNDAVNGVHDNTVTVTDAAAAMGKVQKKLSDVSLVAKDKTVLAHAKTGAIHAGRLRVTFLGQGSSDVKTESDALTADMKAADAACSA